MARALLVLGLIASVVFGWHMYGASDVRRRAEELRARHSAETQDEPVTVNLVTNVVNVPILSASSQSDSDNPFEALGKALGSMLGGALVKALEPSFERDLNLLARERYDVYAMLLPYQVRVITPEREK